MSTVSKEILQERQPFDVAWRTIDGLKIRYATDGKGEEKIVLFSPWPESIFAFVSVWPGLTRQVSIFMSVFDVHVNRAPISGKIIHYRYNPGKKIAAFAEKSSTENEQNLIVVTDDRGATVAFKQIAGLLARRIVFDKKEGDTIVRGERVGMIKFGSRVDMFFPPNAVIKVQMRDKVKVGLTIVAELEEPA